MRPPRSDTLAPPLAALGKAHPEGEAELTPGALPRQGAPKNRYYFRSGFFKYARSVHAHQGMNSANPGTTLIPSS